MVIVVVVNLKGIFKNRELTILICASKVQPPRDDRCDSEYSGPVFLGLLVFTSTSEVVLNQVYC